MIKQTINMLRKELKQGFKSRSVIIIMFVPAIMSILTGLMIGREVKVNVAFCPETQVVEQVEVLDLMEQMKEDEKNIVAPVLTSRIEEAQQMLEDGSVVAIVQIPARLKDKLAGDEQIHLNVTLKKNDSLIQMGLDRIYDGIYQYLGLSKKVQMDIVETEKKATPKANAMDLDELVVSFVATWILFGIFFITIPLGSELLSGEKDKHTFDALLVSGVPYSSIILGKAIYVILVTVMTVLIAGVGVSFLGIHLGIQTLLALIPLTVLISLGLVFIGLSISAVSKSLKESKNLSVVVFLPLPLLVMLPTFLMPKFLIQFNQYFPPYHAKLVLIDLLSQLPLNMVHLLYIAAFDLVFLLVAIGLLRLEPSNS